MGFRPGSAKDELTKFAREWHADLVVLGSHGRGRVKQLLLGSTVTALVHESMRPVLVVSHEPQPQQRAKSWSWEAV